MKITTSLQFTKSVYVDNEYTDFEEKRRYLNCELTVKGNGSVQELSNEGYNFCKLMEHFLKEEGYNFQFSYCPTEEEGEYWDCISILFESGMMTEYKEAVKNAYKEAKKTKTLYDELSEAEEVQEVEAVAEAQEPAEKKVETEESKKINQKDYREMLNLSSGTIATLMQKENISYLEADDFVNKWYEYANANNHQGKKWQESFRLFAYSLKKEQKSYYHIWEGTTDLKGTELKAGQKVRIDLYNMDIKELEELKGVNYREFTEGHTEGNYTRVYIEIIEVYPRYRADKQIKVNEVYRVGKGWTDFNQLMTIQEITDFLEKDRSNMVNIAGKDYAYQMFTMKFPIGTSCKELEIKVCQDTWTAQEIAGDNKLIKMVEDGNIRKCSCCGLYVPVGNYSSEAKTATGKTVFDICDSCKSVLFTGGNVEQVEPNQYEDYLLDLNID